MSDYKVTDTELASVANAIRTKGGTSGQLTFPNEFVTAIENIPSGSSDDEWKSLTDYIESSGTQYIDTGYYPNSNTYVEIVADCAIPQPTRYPTLFGVRPQAYNASGSKDILIHYYDSNTSLTNYIMDTSIGSSNYNRTGNTKAEYSCGKNGYGVLSNSYMNKDKTTISKNIYDTYSIFIFALNSMGTANSSDMCIMKLYRMRIYESDTLVHEFIPWIDDNDVVCLKDTVTGDLKYNAGTGTFTYGTDSE